jgi:putative ABC transport system permease protein
MLPILRFSLQDMFRHFKPWLAMALLVAATTMIYLVLGGYRTALNEEFRLMPHPDLVVEESNTNGEIAGSRIPASVVARLQELGVSRLVPEIHETIGTSMSNITLLRGVDLERYRLVNSFTLLAGRALEPGDPPRTAMLGWRLAERLGLEPGAQVSLRGRSFQVVGIFRLGTYVDNEAWVPLEGAQALLGWSEDVSIYIIPDEGILKDGDTLAGGLSVAKRGLGPQSSREKYEPLLDVIDLTHVTVCIAAILMLANLLFRSAWIRRRDLAILRCVGFQSPGLVVYLFSQALFLAWAGVLLGTAGAALLFSVLRTDMGGLVIQPGIRLTTAFSGLGLATLMAALGALLPAVWLGRMNLSSQLRAE